MNDVLTKIHEAGIVPVVAIDDAKDAPALAQALVAGGLGVCEITFRTDAAQEAIRNITREVPGMMTGAGTVLTKDQADRAVKAGASFIVSPGLNPDVTKHVLSKGVCMIPGVATPSEVEQALALGIDTVKFFPAELSGGCAMIRALSGPYRDVKWLPTGGISPDNIGDYISLCNVIACGGTWMVKTDLIADKRWDEITSLCTGARSIVQKIRAKEQGE